ncbi:MAG: response regulator [Chlorobia bacterium]|nr:response regulator [Fimbriimonadaceae bacterium]
MLPELKDIANLNVLVVDDTEANVVFLRMTLEAAGLKRIFSASNGLEAVAHCASHPTDLIILDLHMPRMDGFQTLEALRPHREGFLPVLVFTADVSSAARRRALDLGATDFLTKPGDVIEIGLRVKNFLEMRLLFLASVNQRELLEVKVKERTKELHEAHVEILARLAMAGEFRDDETGEHTKRVSDLSGKIAIAAGLNAETANIIRYGSLLHDIGKIGIPDAILRKRGPLLVNEREIMMTHTDIGAKLLANSRSPFLRMAQEIALTHHEHWNGQGYPRGLVGELIPISGRIVAIADAFDAMVSNRVYHEAVPIRTAVAEIVNCSGTQFDPKLVQIFLAMMADRMNHQELLAA